MLRPRTLLTLWLLGMLALTTPSLAAHRTPAPQKHSMLRMIGKRYLLTTDKIYTASLAGHGYDVLPLWQQQHATVTGVISLGNRKQWRIWLRTEDGQEGYLDIYSSREIARYMRPTVQAVL